MSEQTTRQPDCRNSATQQQGHGSSIEAGQEGFHRQRKWDSGAAGEDC
jgi:hypothetical protein